MSAVLYTSKFGVINSFIQFNQEDQEAFQEVITDYFCDYNDEDSDEEMIDSDEEIIDTGKKCPSLIYAQKLIMITLPQSENEAYAKIKVAYYAVR